MLEDVVVLIDPLQNPDGRERYVNGYKQRRGEEANPRRAAAEHFEPWPGGRQNHYLIDLNRDWAWASQQETRQRIAAYRSWEPQVYVDFHEMGSESSYFFPPSAEPINPQIDRRDPRLARHLRPRQRRGLRPPGLDLLQGGELRPLLPRLRRLLPQPARRRGHDLRDGGRRPRRRSRVALPDGTVLTLADRVARHLTTSLATVRTAARNSRKLLEDFARQPRQGRRRAGAHLSLARRPAGGAGAGRPARPARHPRAAARAGRRRSRCAR